MEPRQIVEEVVFAISKDAPSYSDDAAMSSFLLKLNPVVAAVFSSWMATGFIENGGLFNIYETCSAEMIQRAAYGFRLLGKADVAIAIDLSSRAFPNCVVPTTESERQTALGEWANRGDANAETEEQQSLAGLDYKFSLTDAYDHTGELLRQYQFEFVCPKS